MIPLKLNEYLSLKPIRLSSQRISIIFQNQHCAHFEAITLKASIFQANDTKEGLRCDRFKPGRLCQIFGVAVPL